MAEAMGASPTASSRRNTPEKKPTSPTLTMAASVPARALEGEVQGRCGTTDGGETK
jgi:hypothetical protein